MLITSHTKTHFLFKWWEKTLTITNMANEWFNHWNTSSESGNYQMIEMIKIESNDI